MTKSNNNILEMRGIVKDFPGVRALDHVDFSVKEGEVHCLLGENGAGKSTLIKILTGVYQPDEGSIYFKNKELSHITPHSSKLAGISAIYQELQLAHSLSIAENIFLGNEPINFLGKIDINKMNQDTAKLFQQLEMVVDPEWLINNVSIGLRQMTEVIKVLNRGGKLVIMDEPTTALNEAETTHLFKTVQRMKLNGISVIYISHRMEEIFNVGDRASVIRDGKLIGTVEINKVTSTKLISMMVGRTIKEKFYKEKVKIGDVLWKGEDLSDSSGSFQGINFFVREGEILGLAGIRGSGFKELARLIGGIESAENGYLINNNGEKYKFKSPQDAILAGIGYLPDDRKGEGLILSLSVSKNLVIPILQKISNHGWVNDRAVVKTSNEYVNNLNIQTPSIDQSVEFLSGGNQQKVVLAKWLASKCNLLVMDAPTQGIDVGAKIEMYKLIAKHVQKNGAVILVSSELPELLAIADRIMVIRQGKVVGSIESSKTTQEKILHLAAQVKPYMPVNHEIKPGEKYMLNTKEPNKTTRNKSNFQLRYFIQANGMVFVLLLLMVFGAILSPYFLTPGNLINLLLQNCTVAIVAMGISFVLISGGIDLSIGSVVGLVAILTCGLTQYSGFKEWQAILLSLVLALAIGAGNGWLISRFRLEPVVVTLGMWYIVQGLVQNYILSRVPTAPPITSFLGTEFILGVPIIVIITFIIAITTHLILTKTVLGRWAFAMGGNLNAARASGVPVNKARIIFFMLSAFYAFITAILMTGRIHAVDASAGNGFVFLAPAAAVVGGTSLFGGRGSAFNAVVGALIMGVISNGLNLTKVNFFWQQVAVGAAILLAVSIDAIQRRHD